MERQTHTLEAYFEPDIAEEIAEFSQNLQSDEFKHYLLLLNEALSKKRFLRPNIVDPVGLTLVIGELIDENFKLKTQIRGLIKETAPVRQRVEESKKMAPIPNTQLIADLKLLEDTINEADEKHNQYLKQIQEKHSQYLKQIQRIIERIKNEF